MAKRGGTCASSSCTEAEIGEFYELIDDEVKVARPQGELMLVLDDVLDEHQSCQVISKSVFRM